MDWWQVLFLIVGGLIALMLIRVPVAFSFFTVNIVAAIFLWGGGNGLIQLIQSIEDSLTTFALVPIPLFILMGEIMFHTGIAPKMIDSVDKWIGRLPGRLSLLAVGSGTLLSTLTGSTMASTAVLGSTLIPEMEQRGYKKPMTIGPILGSGGLAVMIPPSALGVLLASIGKISIGAFMIAIILPGILMAFLFALYIILRAKMQPELAPKYSLSSVPLMEKIRTSIIYILPLGFIIFLVVGLIFLGIATPTEAAAMGAFGSVVLAALYGRLNWASLQKAFTSTMKVSVMILIIVAGSTAFSHILSFSGVTRNLVELIQILQFSPIIILIAMLLLVIIMGTFMESLSIMMIILPMFIPIAQILDINLLWFATMLLITIEIGAISPPFGVGLFVMKGVAPRGTKMKEIYSASFPFIALDIVLIILVFLFPELATWLPELMKN
ncbi:TRAP transporter large permease [Mesobacillus selenatarsenatis]|uniref:TRAP-type C4-dicarboxylate transport system, large permease component n=1 Tax=Mesobacillus selenatarsenatis (strain DSM 18680 / JCM 14380 / FERM P-15431 / SF-1) TaxID=1321606 RepID=A0A0A8X1T7_MESS1|nr:TRAP transporter large permease subunit [Mesobacillus selenatarsenatis]GAM13234.1 TRAP-type C4-dicarboxylate transport system, large permease component [Mesobacillus selenatarsenatis SF-1]